MNDEIKKILDRLERIDHKEYICGFEFADSASFDEMARCFEERKKMANYITNLQQKVEQYENPEDLTLFYMWLDEKAKEKMKELQQEIQRKDAYIKYLQEYNPKYYKGEKFYGDESRIDKAIEYIEKEYQDNIIITDYADNPITPQELYGELLDILEGDSNE